MMVVVKLWELQVLLVQEILFVSQSSVFLGFVIVLCLVGVFIWWCSCVGLVCWYVVYIVISVYSVYKMCGLVGLFFYLDLVDGGDVLFGVVLVFSVVVVVLFSVCLMLLCMYFLCVIWVYEILVWVVIVCVCVGFLLGWFGMVMFVV